MPQVRLSAVIPAYNEEKTVGKVVEVVKAAGFFEQIIVVSDGSTDRTAEIARQAGAEVVGLKENQGKGAAVAAGLARTGSPLVCFLDADLINLKPEHLQRMAEPVLSGRWVMSVGMWDRGPILNVLARLLPLISGQRVLCREVFEKLPPEFRSGYKMETAMTWVCRNSRLPHGRVALPGLKIVRKMNKVGFCSGLVGYLLMFGQVLGAMIEMRIVGRRRFVESGREISRTCGLIAN